MRWDKAGWVSDVWRGFKALWTYSAWNGSKGGHSLDVVGIASSKGIALRILTALQHKLVTHVISVLVADPPEDKHGLNLGSTSGPQSQCCYYLRN